MKKTFVFVFLLLVSMASGFAVNGCWGETASTFVTKANNFSRIIDYSEIRVIHRVYVMPGWENSSSVTKPEPDDSATMFLWNEIGSSRMFSLVPMDSVEMYLKKFSVLDTNALLNIADSLRVDGFVMLTIRYSKADFGVTNTATVTLRLASVRTHKIIAYSLFDTYSTHSYLLPPSHETVMKDAIEGAVSELEEAIKNMGQ